MLSKEEVLEIISYCDSHKIQRSVRLKELGITHWEFYKSRRKYLENEKSHPHEDSVRIPDDIRSPFPVISVHSG